MTLQELYAKRLNCTVEELESKLHVLPLEVELKATMKASQKKLRFTLDDIMKEVE